MLLKLWIRDGGLSALSKSVSQRNFRISENTVIILNKVHTTPAASIRRYISTVTEKRLS